MTGQQLSYAHGGCETPLIYQTIGARFDEAAARWPDREAFVVCDQGVRLTFAEMKREVDRLAAGLLALGLQPGRSDRHLVAEQRGLGADAVCHREGGIDPGEHQSRIPHRGT